MFQKGELILSEDKMNPFFSIIVPVYNVEKYIEKCLRSIYDQTFYDYEVIIVNDVQRMHRVR